MGISRQTASNDSGFLQARPWKPQLHTRAAGFILVYVLWLLVAITVSLAYVAKQSRMETVGGGGQFLSALKERRLINVAGYVLGRTSSRQLPVDPRLIEYQQMQQTDQGDEQSDKLRFLKELLKQMKFDLDLGKEGEEPADDGPEAAGEDQVDSVPTMTLPGLYPPGGESYKLEVGGVEYRISVRPVNALPNINRLPRDALERYLRHLGYPAEESGPLAARLVDWVDADDFISSDQGAEAGLYQRHITPYKPHNAPLEQWGEIYYLWESSPQLGAALRPHFVLFGEESKVDADYLDAAALAALTGLPTDLIERVQKNRKQEHRRPLEDLMRLDAVQAFRRMVTWKAVNNPRLIDINDGQQTLHLVWDNEQQRLLDWHFSAIYPSPEREEQP